MKRGVLLVLFGLLLMVGPYGGAMIAAAIDPKLAVDGGVAAMGFFLTFLTAPLGLVWALIGLGIGRRKKGCNA
jgi:hypothetical protein